MRHKHLAGRSDWCFHRY